MDADFDEQVASFEEEMNPICEGHLTRLQSALTSRNHPTAALGTSAPAFGVLCTQEACFSILWI
jgi:hypothetical protein